jgi:gluconolactonase
MVLGIICKPLALIVLQIVSPKGKHLGTIVIPQHVHNMAWGDDDGKTLNLCARNGLYKIKLNIAGVRPKSQTGAQ